MAVKTQLELKIDNIKYSHEFCVLKRLIFKIIIGVDFLKKYGAAMRFVNEEMRLKLVDNKTERRVINAIDVKETGIRLQEMFEKHATLF